MTQLQWGLPQDQIFEDGLDRGVLYLDDGTSAAWNGLVSVDDAGSSTTKEYYLDGVPYLSTVSPRDWKGSLSAYTYPDEFAELIGLVELGDGFYADSQVPDRFGLSYRTRVSAPNYNNESNYKIHLIYNVIASLSSFSNNTLTDSISPEVFNFNLTAVPIVIPYLRPTAHFVIDGSKADPDNFSALETILYGDEDTDPALPTISELIDLLPFTSAVEVFYNGDGTWTAIGSARDIHEYSDDSTFRIDRVDATYLTDEIYEFNLQRNLLRNPSAEFDTGWVDNSIPGANVLSWSDEWFYAGKKSRKGVATGTSPALMNVYNAGDILDPPDSVNLGVPVQVGSEYKASVRLYAGQAGYKGELRLRYWDSDLSTELAITDPVFLDLPANTVVKIEVQGGVVPASTNPTAYLILDVVKSTAGNATAGHYVYADAAILTDGLYSGTSPFELVLDSDGVPYWGSSLEGIAHMGLDTDGTPYYGADLSTVSLYEDTDGVPYFDSDS